MGIAACAVVDLDFAYTHARSSGLLPREGDDLSEVRSELRRLQADHGFPLSDNGLPKNAKPKGWLAADTCALMAADHKGKVLAEQVHQDLQSHHVWVWREGCIEHVLNIEDKGEEAIIEQEQRLRAMGAADIEQQMPSLKACFDWIKSL